MFEAVADRVPAGVSGDVAIEHVLHEGERYAKLLIDGQCWMSDAPDERQLNRVIVERAFGDLLICGLGLGMILPPILAKSEVRSVTVLERNLNVLSLIGGCYSDAKLTLLHADAWFWQSEGRQFDVIWQDVVFDPPSEMKLVRAFEAKLTPYLKPGGWLGSWKVEE